MEVTPKSASLGGSISCENPKIPQKNPKLPWIPDPFLSHQLQCFLSQWRSTEVMLVEFRTPAATSTPRPARFGRFIRDSKNPLYLKSGSNHCGAYGMNELYEYTVNIQAILVTCCDYIIWQNWRNNEETYIFIYLLYIIIPNNRLEITFLDFEMIINMMISSACKEKTYSNFHHDCTASCHDPCLELPNLLSSIPSAAPVGLMFYPLWLLVKRITSKRSFGIQLPGTKC